ncbi:hypothetical protein [Nitrospira sp. M1]
MNWVIGEAIFWAFLPVCIAYLTWDVLQNRRRTVAETFTDWTVFKSPLLCGLIPTLSSFALDWLLGLSQEGISGDEGGFQLLLSSLSVGVFGVLYACLLLCCSLGILFMADRGVSVKVGLDASLRAINYHAVKVILLHLGWMLNAGVLALVTGGVASLLATFVFPESFFVISLQHSLELGILAENVSEEAGEIALNLFVLAFEYVGVAIGYGIGLCTFAVAYAQVFGLPGYTPSASVQKS